jgi:hypothetical protein
MPAKSGSRVDLGISEARDTGGHSHSERRATTMPATADDLAYRAKQKKYEADQRTRLSIVHKILT